MNDFLNRTAGALLVAGVLFGCGGAQQSAAGADSAVIVGKVTERSEGVSKRPGWADEGQPFSRDGDYLRTVGYVRVDGEARPETAYRAADSYARAELIRFLGARIVAVLEDKLDDQGVQELEERINETAALWTGDLPISTRYWERRKDGQKLTLHVWSRLDLSPEEFAELSQRILATAEPGALPDTLSQDLGDSWESIADPARFVRSIPDGVFVPDWAKKGDQQTNEDYQFVCHGQASDEKTARILAQSQCSEKLCKLFGVQITAEMSVVENLDGMSATSEVKERCPDIRVVGRETIGTSGECGPKGCIYWVKQSYPKNSYEEEKKRLAEPTIVRQEVVIQEGDKVYKDPKLCEQELVAYGALEGRTVEVLQKRLRHVKRARQACAGVDARDSGLFSLMTDLLERPIPGFTTTRATYETPYPLYFLYTREEWLRKLQTTRFFDERLLMVQRLLSDAIDPIRAFEAFKTKPVDLKLIQEASAPLYKQPFQRKPTSPTHAVNVHYVHNARPRDLNDPEFRKFLLTKTEGAVKTCENDFFKHDTGAWVVSKLAADGVLDEKEWAYALRLGKRDQQYAFSCVKVGISKAPSASVREQRVEQLLTMVEKGSLKFQDGFSRSQDKMRALKSVACQRGVPAQDGLKVVEKWSARLPGDEKSQKALQKSLLGKLEPERKATVAEVRRSCQEYIDGAQRIARVLPLTSVHDIKYEVGCQCLNARVGLDRSTRRAFVETLSVGNYRVCDTVKDEEWPGGLGVTPQRPQPPASATKVPSRGRVLKANAPAHPYDVARAVRGQIKECLDVTHVTSPRNGILPAWVTLITTASSSGFAHPQAEVRVRGSARSLKTQDAERKHSWVRQSDIRQTEREVTSCIEQAVRNTKIPPDSAMAHAAPKKVWLLFSSYDVVDGRWMR